ncbi:peptide-methionine (R)-S-oxide reductase MsrB [Aliikangiella sp. G2MR2-5]|uniref:peptide-methionine (R)-S-oxide reductase MsrB n=1 Tax=Aliikangiella sp. G2MR2-5 TaxID=2788943 RepID=UPI0018AAB19B|nr:peptide-methionine (R)-S-oxide reductase MsrB [Aliikangiella sp. G2MR2-5]
MSNTEDNTKSSQKENTISRAKLKKQLSPLAWKVTQEHGTEPPYSGEFNDFDQPGQYECICCGSHLFTSEHKFNSQCGWPAFYKGLEDNIKESMDYSHGMTRIEVTCSNCGSHLGHKFADGPYGTRYCINSVALEFKSFD